MLYTVHFTWHLNKNYNLTLKPYDTDGIGGFGPLEELWLRMSYMAIPILLLPIILFLLNHFFGIEFNPLSTSLVCGIIVVVLLVIPILNFRHIVERGKANLLESIGTKIRKYQKKIEECLYEDKVLEESYMKKIVELEKIVLRTKNVSSLPFKKYQKLYIFLSAITPWITGIISYSA